MSKEKKRLGKRRLPILDNPAYCRIIFCLCFGELRSLRPQEIANELKINQSVVIKHLKTLQKEHYVNFNLNKRTKYYSLNFFIIIWALDKYISSLFDKREIELKHFPSETQLLKNFLIEKALYKKLKFSFLDSPYFLNKIKQIFINYSVINFYSKNLSLNDFFRDFVICSGYEGKSSIDLDFMVGLGEEDNENAFHFICSQLIVSPVSYKIITQNFKLPYSKPE